MKDNEVAIEICEINNLEPLNHTPICYGALILRKDYESPIFVELEVTYTEPGFSGNTTTTSGKPATLENGYEISVPLFINIGDVIRIDTRTGEYMERV